MVLGRKIIYASSGVLRLIGIDGSQKTGLDALDWHVRVRQVGRVCRLSWGSRVLTALAAERRGAGDECLLG